MEMHFVHASEAGELAVVGVLFTSGEASGVLGPIWIVLPAQAGDETMVAAFNLPALLPSDHTAYRDSGSLTTPPCSEGVKWSVLRNTLPMAPAQAQAFSDLVEPTTGPCSPSTRGRFWRTRRRVRPRRTSGNGFGRGGSRPSERNGSCAFQSARSLRRGSASIVVLTAVVGVIGISRLVTLNEDVERITEQDLETIVLTARSRKRRSRSRSSCPRACSPSWSRTVLKRMAPPRPPSRARRARTSSRRQRSRPRSPSRSSRRNWTS